MKKIIISMLFLSFVVQVFALGSRECGYYIKRVFSKEIEKMDCASFEQITGDYYKDKDNVYLYLDNNSRYIGFVKLDNLDTSTFTVIDGEYVRDNKIICMLDGLLEGADIDTFVILDIPLSKDKNTVYY